MVVQVWACDNHITSHHITSHHITSHHITSHMPVPQARLAGLRDAALLDSPALVGWADWLASELAAGRRLAGGELTEARVDAALQVGGREVV
jgi:hypothetical protein